MFTAHGKTYRTEADALARLKELAEGNRLYGRSDGRVTEQSALFDALEAERQRVANAAARAAERPYVALTRDYDAAGKCRKGRRTFKTQAALSRFLWTTDKCVTYHN